MVTGVEFIPLSASVEIVVSQKSFRVSAEIEKEVQFIWEEQSKQNSKLFDGTFACLEKYSKEQITLQIIPYRYLVARQISPRLRSVINVNDCGIFCATFCEDSVLLGQRAPWVFVSPNAWETVPSGTIEKEYITKNNTIRIYDLVRDEFSTETGLDASEIDNISIVGLFLNKKENSYCIGFKIDVNKDTKNKHLSSDEYTMLHWENGKNAQKNSKVLEDSRLLIAQAYKSAYMN